MLWGHLRESLERLTLRINTPAPLACNLALLQPATEAKEHYATQRRPLAQASESKLLTADELPVMVPLAAAPL